MKAQIKSFVILMTLILCGTGNSYAQHPAFNTNDSLALVAIFNSTGGASWTNPWKMDLEEWESPRNWRGVYMNAEDTRVEKLILPANNMVGVLPTEIGNLTACVELVLNANQLSGTIPGEIKNMVKLEMLNLGYNQLEGNVPDFGELTSLKYLTLADNKFEGGVPNFIGYFDNLVTLHLGNNQFTGSIPESFTNLNKLNSFDIRNNLLEGEFPINSLLGMTKLGSLILSNNKFEGPIPVSIQAFNSVGLLWLNGNAFTSVPYEINNLSKMISLYLNDNFISDLPEIHGMPDLGYLHLVGNRLFFEDIIPNLDAATVVNYVPQREVGAEVSIICEPGDTKYLKWELVGDDNYYQWFKDGIELSSATQNEYILEDIAFKDDGDYTLQVSNVKVPLLTLETYPISIAVRVSFFDGLSGDFKEFSIKVVQVWGEVELMRVNQDPVELLGGEVLVPSDRIYTAMMSSVKLAFANNSTVLVKELTDLKIGSFQDHGNAVQTQIWLKAGEVDAAVTERSAVKSDFKVRTPTATCSVRGTNFSVKHDSTSSITTVMVSEGSVNIIPEFSPADSLLLTSWQMATVSESAISPAESFSLNRIEINPDTTWVPTDNVRLFFASGYDNDGNSTSIPVHWESEAGTFNDTTNFFYSGTAAGEFIVTATEPVSKLTASAVIIVKEGAASVSPEIIIPTTLSLSQNYPNPFKAFTRIDYNLPLGGYTTLKIFNILGEEVAELVNEVKEAGKHSIQLNAQDLENGIYFYKLESGESVEVKRMLLLR